ncbi:hypothetical protein ACFC9N_11205 [Enterococcus casseliflavus]|uniref:hypothetical protein n=1 Tax=Enterococcus TaxID=1350 RepID=UPI000A3A3541|nr:hypothetical protein [Enterococcus sp. 4E1_DIV0656]OTO09244.1 hypothetical protein A5882_003577 [Enterococcus sp. 4E1_DIV0656]OTO09246.1 hypothetical protein A5882_003579 [Enterococcus sp. 4E1_DIV0656]
MDKEILKPIRFPVFEGHSYLVTYSNEDDEKFGMYVKAIDVNDAMRQVAVLVPGSIKIIDAKLDTPPSSFSIN